MTELPSREKQLTWRERGAIVNSWADRELMTAAEWRDTIDYEAGWEQLPKRPVSLAQFVFAFNIAIGLDQNAAVRISARIGDTE